MIFPLGFRGNRLSQLLCTAKFNCEENLIFRTKLYSNNVIFIGKTRQMH